MPNAKNQEMLANVKADLEATSAVWVVDYCGLTVKQIQELRRSVREAGACHEGVQEHPHAHRSG